LRENLTTFIAPYITDQSWHIRLAPSKFKGGGAIGFDMRPKT
jgi:hypothetical protein